jgi:hypothetical protein
MFKNLIQMLTIWLMCITQGFVKEGALGATETTETDLGDIEITAKDVRAIVAIAGPL